MSETPVGVGRARGGHARAAKLTPAERLNIARKAANVRWSKPRATNAPIPTEAREQQTVVEWLTLHRISFCHVPNGGRRDKITAAILCGQGVIPGVPDLLIFTLPPVKPHARGVFIEMKRRKGGRLSEAQRDFCQGLLSCGWEGTTAEGAGEAIDYLESLGYGKRR